MSALGNRCLKLRLVGAALCAAMVAACGGSSPTAPSQTPEPTAGLVTARLDGVAFRASSVARASVSGSTISVSGAQGIVGLRFSFTGAGPGTYTVQTAAVVNGDQSWSVNGSFGGDGSSGTATVTRLSGTRVAGTFQMTAVQPSTRAVLRVTEGTFDVPVE